MFGAGVVLLLSACCSGNGSLTKSSLDPARFDTIIDGKAVKLYTLSNAGGMEVCVTNYGARLISVMAKDKNNAYRDVVLAYDNISQYADTANSAFDFGAVAGRYANCGNREKLFVNGKEIQLPRNSGVHGSAGGADGWQYRVFDTDETATNDTTIVFSLHSPDGDGGFEGSVDATVTYTLTSENTLDISFEAATDAPTAVNMMSNPCFNLSGNPSVPCTNMVLYINADNYMPADTACVATGEVRSVYGNQFDFRKAKALYTCIADTTGYNGIQIKSAGGFDHNWCLNTFAGGKGDDSKIAASLYSPDSGIFMQIYTTEPGLKCHTCNLLSGNQKGKNGTIYPKQAAVCLATGKLPEAADKENGTQNRLNPGEKYRSHTAYRFSVK